MAKRKNISKSHSDIEPYPKRRSNRLKCALADVKLAIPTYRASEIVSAVASSSFEAQSTDAQKNLQDLLEMPEDIFREVLRHLDPQDLLNLFHSASVFRTFLLHKSSAPTWAAARANLPGLPPRIKSMNEASYASFLFDKHCEICQVPYASGQNTFWDIQMRVCSACQFSRSIFLPENSFEFQPQPPFIDKKEFLSLVPTMFCGSLGGWMPKIVQNHLTQYEEMVTDEDSFKQWRARMNKEREERRKWCDYHYDWLRIDAERCERQMEQRKEGNLEIWRTRYKDITVRLIALGWKEEVIPTQLAQHPQVKKLQQLTDEEWIEISPTLVEYIKTQIQDAGMVET
ncbi:hypothetical protein C8R41DRAFT_828027 [Lentinula lateritia]|uniref:F-box domain-containing protein n=1 Tax=Lentinula lateritia TaxID=40482 RepID=A0ABQ8VII6_9AGAR|nr:hypothetical protein C8R41DRAFT_828027 [Lentinula lateritia]